MVGEPGVARSKFLDLEGSRPTKGLTRNCLRINGWHNMELLSLNCGKALADIIDIGGAKFFVH